MFCFSEKKGHDDAKTSVFIACTRLTIVAVTAVAVVVAVTATAVVVVVAAVVVVVVVVDSHSGGKTCGYRNPVENDDDKEKIRSDTETK